MSEYGELVSQAVKAVYLKESRRGFFGNIDLKSSVNQSQFQIGKP